MTLRRGGEGDEEDDEEEEEADKAKGGIAAASVSRLPAFDPIPLEERIERNRKAAALIRSWMDEDSGYDEEVGAALEAMGEWPVRFRENFD